MAGTIPNLTISSMRGGCNNSDHPMTLPEDQCVSAVNVEFTGDSPCGERRRGCATTDVATLTAALFNRVTALYRHLPTSDETGSELWAWCATNDAASDGVPYRRDTTWHAITSVDSCLSTSPYNGNYRIQMQTLHGGLFIAYPGSYAAGNVDRLHRWDSVNNACRRTGLPACVIPAAVDTAVAGAFANTRYYRIRVTEQQAGVTVRRSEPSPVKTFPPNGAFNGAIITYTPTAAPPNEYDTHWELEASEDGANFFVLATTIRATPTYTDTTAYATGYNGGTLSEQIGANSLIPAGCFVVADDDRLLIGGSFFTEAEKSRVRWTPVRKSTGVGNDERLDLTTDPFIDLDTTEGGPMTGMAQPVLGTIFVFKLRHIYQLTRTGNRIAAYTSTTLTKKRGAIYGSVVSGTDWNGNPCIYFLDPSIGPCMLSPDGVIRCGADIRTTWKTFNVNAAKTWCNAVFFADNHQVQWRIATGSSDIPSAMIVLQTNTMRMGEDGARRGWTLWTGPTAGALCATMYASNSDAGIARTLDLVPYIGMEGQGLIWRTNTGTTDAGTAYASSVTSRPYTSAGILNEFGVLSAAVVGKADATVYVKVQVVKDFDTANTVPVDNVSFAPAATETQVIKRLDNLGMAELHAMQITVSDGTSNAGRWELGPIAVNPTKGLTA